jgi:hypothetical protein
MIDQYHSPFAPNPQYQQPYYPIVPATPNVTIEHSKVVLDENGNVREMIQDKYPASQAKEFFQSEVEKESIIQSAQNQQLAIQLEHERQLMQGQMQFMTNYMGYQMQRAQLQLAEAYAGMQQQVLNLIGEVRELKEQQSLPIEEQKLLANNAQRWDRNMDMRNVTEVDYEVVEEKRSAIPETYENEKLQTEGPFVGNVKIHIGRKFMDEHDQVAQEDQTGSADRSGYEHVAYVNTEDYGIKYDEQTGRFNNVPMNFVIENGPAVKNVTVLPFDGKKALLPEQCEGVVAPNKPGWKEVKYLERVDVACDIFATRGNDPHDINLEAKSLSLECLKEHRMSIYKHAIPTNTVQIPALGGKADQPWWEAFDIPFVADWKMLVARYVEGLTNGKAAIVRLLLSGEEYSCDYLTLYMRGTMLSSYFNKKYSDAINAGETRPQIAPMCYSATKFNDPAYSYFIHMLFYAYTLNGNKAFAIAEQLAADEKSGDQRVMLTKSELKTEIREEFNIFKGPHPESVFTNYPVQSFMCGYNAETKNFEINRRFRAKFPPQKKFQPKQ